MKEKKLIPLECSLEELYDSINFLNALIISLDMQGNYEKYRNQILLLTEIVKEKIDKQTFKSE